MPYSGGRKRGHHHGGGPFSDHAESGSHVKLYVSHIPRTATEEEIRPLFEEHGRVIEVILLRDKLTGQQHGSCFVKYGTLDEADRAIRALHSRYSFPGEMYPIKVKFAERDRERIGTVAAVNKLYVGSLNAETSKKDIEEIFSPYGFVEDIYIVRDEMRQSRCAFVKFPQREMALAAIHSLNGIFKMRGSDQPLVVRFADPKKPRIGEPRGTYGDFMGGYMQANALYPPQQISAGSQLDIVPPMAAFGPLQQPLPPQKFSHSQPSQMALQRTQTPDTSNPSSQGVVEGQNKLHVVQSSCQNSEQQQIPRITRHESPQSGSTPHLVTAPPIKPAASVSSQTVNSLESDWSEHTCLDGHKYYYNCVTFESTWEKPKEFSLLEQQLQNSRNQLKSHPPVSFNGQVPQRDQVSDVVCIHSESATVIGPTCV